MYAVYERECLDLSINFVDELWECFQLKVVVIVISEAFKEIPLDSGVKVCSAHLFAVGAVDVVARWKVASLEGQSRFLTLVAATALSDVEESAHVGSTIVVAVWGSLAGDAPVVADVYFEALPAPGSEAGEISGAHHVDVLAIGGLDERIVPSAGWCVVPIWVGDPLAEDPGLDSIELCSVTRLGAGAKDLVDLVGR